MTGRFAARAAAVADVAAKYADEVDRDERPPIEAVMAMKEQRLLSLSVPTTHGGEGASMLELSEIATTIGAADANAGMVFAMHHSQALPLWRHGSRNGVRSTIGKVLSEEWLLGSATTERGIGGDARRSSCALEYPAPGRVRLVKDAPVLSYAEAADAILVTGRVSADAPASDQRMLICAKGEYTLEKTGVWHGLGLRGTASDSFIISAETSDDMLLDDPYGTISAHTALPAAHLLWASVWLGIAESAVDKARIVVRKAAQKAIGTTPPGATRLAELLIDLQAFADIVASAARRFDELSADPAALESVSVASAMNGLKITASERVADIVDKALLITGIAGYRLDSELSLGRMLRDSHGAAVMVNNDRILANNALMALVQRKQH